MEKSNSRIGKLIWSSNEGLDVSSWGNPPYKILSPFMFGEKILIPIPEEKNSYRNAEDRLPCTKLICAHSVEGIWQGQKLICGSRNTELFYRRPNKRKGKPEGHVFGRELLEDPIEARKKIYQPTYIHYLVNYALPAIADDLETKLQEGNVTFHDREKNKDINNPQRSYSHAALAVETINLMHKLELPLRKPEKPNPHASKFTYLHEHVEFISSAMQKMNKREKELTDDLLTYAFLFSPDEQLQIYALTFIKKTENQTNRIKEYLPTKGTKQFYDNCFLR